jgi:hypothetical protein
MIKLIVEDDAMIRLKAEGKLPALVADFAGGVRAVARLIAESLPDIMPEEEKQKFRNDVNMIVLAALLRGYDDAAGQAQREA